MGIRRMPYAFTELGVAMLSSVLNSKTAIQINMGIMRAFVAVREAITQISDTDKRLKQLEQNFTELKADLEEIFTDYNDINEDTRLQLKLLNESMAELQADKVDKAKQTESGIPSTTRIGKANLRGQEVGRLVYFRLSQFKRSLRGDCYNRRAVWPTVCKAKHEPLLRAYRTWHIQSFYRRKNPCGRNAVPA